MFIKKVENVCDLNVYLIINFFWDISPAQKRVLFSNAYESTLYHYHYRKKICICISISEDTTIIIHLFISLYKFLLESLDSFLSCPHVNFKK